MKVYCLRWTGTGQITTHSNYTNVHRAEQHCRYANESLPWYKKLFPFRWAVMTIEVRGAYAEGGK